MSGGLIPEIDKSGVHLFVGPEQPVIKSDNREVQRLIRHNLSLDMADARK